MKKLLHCFGAGSLLLVLCNLHAGDISGRVFDSSTGGGLPGAVVTIPSLGISTSTSRSGDFRLNGLADGSYDVKASSIGHDDATRQVTVGGNATASVEFALTGNDVVKMDPFKVGGLREARLMALQQKQSAQNVMDVLSADSVGKLPDTTAAEAISRLPGLYLMRDETAGEGEFISIRGVAPNLNQTTLDGATLANPGAGFDGLDRAGRAMPLSVIGSAQIAQVEVIKVPTPDMDGSGLGGTINIVTPSAYDRSHPFAFGTLDFGLNSLGNWARRDQYSADFTYGSTFGQEKQWGVMVSANISNRPYRNDQIQGSGYTDNNGQFDRFVPTGLEMHPIWGTHNSLGVTTNLEYRPDADHRYFLRYTYNKLDEFQQREEERWNPGGALTYDPISHIGQWSASQSEQREFRTKKVKALNNLSTGATLAFDNLTVTPQLTYSNSTTKLPYDNSLQFRQPGGTSGPLGFDVSNYYYDTFTDPSKFNDHTTYALRRSIESDGEVVEDTYSPKVDFKWDTNNILGHYGYFKVGVKYTSRDREVTQSSYRLVGPLTLAGVGVLPGKVLFDGKYRQPFTYKWDETWAAIRAAKAAGILSYDPEDSQSNGIEDAYSMNEDIVAGYGMAHADIGKLSVTTGLRWEHTKSTVKAFQATYKNGNFTGIVPAPPGEASYGNFLPNLQFKYNFSDKLIGRAAISRTLGRPDFHDAAPISSFKYEDQGLVPQFPNIGSLSIGNPDLTPYTAYNYDLSLDYYLKNVGLVSVALFYKDISDPIYSYNDLLIDTTYNGVALHQLGIGSKRNAESGKIQGVELTVNIPFTFLPSPFDGLGVETNGAIMDSSVTVTGRGDLPFFNQPDRVANLALYYQKYRWAARLAYQYFGSSLTSIGGSTLGTQDVYHRQHHQIDAQVSYKLSDLATIYVSAQNLSESWDENYYGYNFGFAKVNIYPRTVHAGVRLTF